MLNSLAIIGTGRIGARLAEALISDQVCKEIQLWNRSADRLRGTLASLRMYGKFIGSPVKILELDWARLDAVDAVIVAVKDDYDPRVLVCSQRYPAWFPVNLRTVGFRQDIPIISAVAERLKGYCGRVWVITNPVDIVSSILQTRLNKAQVLGFGISLDAARLTTFLMPNRKTQPLHSLALLGGEHGGQLIPLRSVWPKYLKSPTLSRRRISSGMAQAKTFGVNLVNDLGYTLHDCVAVFVEDVKWLAGMGQQKFRAFSIWDDTACIGWPVVRDTSNTVIKFVKLPAADLNRIHKARNRVFEITSRVESYFRLAD